VKIVTHSVKNVTRDTTNVPNVCITEDQLKNAHVHLTTSLKKMPPVENVTILAKNVLTTKINVPNVQLKLKDLLKLTNVHVTINTMMMVMSNVNHV
jgi:hypothetical protein